MPRPAASLCLLPIFACLTFQSSGAAPKLQLPFTVKVLFSTGYDDNILRYSDLDLNRFEINSEPSPSEITTTDDWINTFGLRLYRDFNLGRRFKLRGYYAGKISLYAVNQLKNYPSHSFLTRLAYRHLGYLSLKYFYLPGFYLRTYKDKDWDEYRGAQFDLFRPAASLRVRPPGLELEAEFGRELIYYSEYFTEYDAEAFFWNLSASRKIMESLDITAGYGFKSSDNVGFDQIGSAAQVDPTADTEYGDASYEEDEFSLNLSYLLPLLSEWDWTIGLRWQHSLRYYQSALPAEQDLFHVGRKDRRDSLEPSLTLSPSPALELELRFTYDRRRTTSPSPAVSQIKDYDQHILEFTVIYQVF
jgi:hypothetical protein